VLIAFPGLIFGLIVAAILGPGSLSAIIAIFFIVLATKIRVVRSTAMSALDASVRIRVLELLRDQSRKRGFTVLPNSHDLWAVRQFCDRIAIMCGGRLVEEGPAGHVFSDPAHPYTRALLGATAGQEKQGEALATIPGIPPLLHGPALGCAFAERCACADETCHAARPKADHVAKDWSLLCHHWQALR
jgi:oligopeptide/dipeptide ABC transporter ATP-binding protein